MPSQAAKTLSDAHSCLDTTPLRKDHPFYTDLSEARSSTALRKLELKLRQARTSSNTSQHFAFIGHRGSGKSTELIRLEEKLSDEFEVIHLYLDGSLQTDADYPELLLWLVESVAKQLFERDLNPPRDLVNQVASWFAETTELDTTSKTSAATIEASAEVGTAASFFGNGYKLLLKVKSAITGSHDFRTSKRVIIKQRFDELIELVNIFLDAAKNTVPDKSLLIIQDNLDRIDRESALRLFRDSGELLQRLRGIFIWTAPVGTQVAPFNIASVFPDPTFMPMISVKNRNGNTRSDATKDLFTLLSKRLDMDAIFANDNVAKKLISFSGGSVRDLIRLTDAARLNALVEDREKITTADVTSAAKNFALTLQQALVPYKTYFKILAQIHQDKSSSFSEDKDNEEKAIENHRSFVHDLIVASAIFVYNGDSIWYDIHPTLEILTDFKEVQAELEIS